MTPPTEDQRELYRAYSCCYATEASTHALTFWIDAAFAAIAGLVAFLDVSAHAKGFATALDDWVPVFALVWLVARELHAPLFKADHRQQAVTIQEQFDLTFWRGAGWESGWNSMLLGPPLPSRVIKKCARDYEGPPLEDDYFVDSTGIETNAAALLRIVQSAAWGAVGHGRYALVNRSCAIVAGTGVVLLAAFTGLSTRATATVLMAVAPLLVGRMQSAAAHASLADRRQELERHLQHTLRESEVVPFADVRSAQDQLCRLRLEQRRIPSWLYHRYVQADQESIDVALTELGDTLRMTHPSGDPSVPPNAHT